MNSLNQHFASELRSRLKARYGKVPSCSVVARDFSLLAKNTNPISIETVRKWLNGECLPHITRLQVLQAWLGLNLTSPEINGKIHTQNSIHKSDESEINEIAKEIERLDSESKELIKQLIKSLQNKGRK